MESFKKFVEEDILEIEPVDYIEYSQVLRTDGEEDYGSNVAWGVDIIPLTTKKNVTTNMSSPYIIETKYTKEEFIKTLKVSEKFLCITQHNVASILDRAKVFGSNLEVRGAVGTPKPYHNDDIMYKVITPSSQINKLGKKYSYIRNTFKDRRESFLVPSSIKNLDKEVKDTFLDLYKEI